MKAGRQARWQAGKQGGRQGGGRQEGKVGEVGGEVQPACRPSLCLDTHAVAPSLQSHYFEGCACTFFYRVKSFAVIKFNVT
jgi:hypothetical protein